MTTASVPEATATPDRVQPAPSVARSPRACPLCESLQVLPSWVGGHRYRERRYDIVRCGACGLFFLDPLPDEALLMEVYRGSEYFDAYVAPGTGEVGYLNSLHADNQYDEMTLAALQAHRPQGRLLDVGCAGGRFLARARAVGYEVAGVEPNASCRACLPGTLCGRSTRTIASAG